MIAIFRQVLATILCLALAVAASPDSYGPVGNRLQKTSTLAGLPGGLSNCNANDQLATDTYDANGNTTASNGNGYVYDFENHLVQEAGTTIVYDGDGNRVAKSTANGTKKFLVDDLNATGYAQVMDELQSGNVARTYTWGLELISERQSVNSTPSTSYYVFDGHGSVRALTDTTGAVTDTYDYDAFGNLIHSTGTTPNNYLFSGEQFDPDLGLYYNRARYLNVSTGRFWSMDTFEGDPQSPESLHKYLYTSADPVNRLDISGHDDFSLGSLAVTAAVGGVIAGLSAFSYQLYKGNTLGQAAKAGAVGFLVGAGITATVYAVVWAGLIAYVGYATGGLTFSLQVYNSFLGGQVNVVELEEDLVVVRYYGGQAAQLGRYWTTQFYDSAVGAIEELSLNPNFGNTLSRVVTGVIPKGTQILAGYAAAQGSLSGGGVQIFLQNTDVIRILSDTITQW